MTEARINAEFDSHNQQHLLSTALGIQTDIVKAIPLSKPCVTGREIAYIQQAISSNKLAGDGSFTNQCQVLLEQAIQAEKIFITPSGTAALEMAAILADIQPGDEVIMPSYTFVSTANALILRGAKIVFVDIRPDTMNIDESLIEAAISPYTKAIVPVHYAGVACEMDTIMDIAQRHDLLVIEDAAQALFSYYKGRALGTIGDFGCFSFHETKNYTCGEGGAISINHEHQVKIAEVIREKGTNKSQFLRGDIDRYTWMAIGSSYLPSELQSAYLYANLQAWKNINQDRQRSWNLYQSGLSPLQESGQVTLGRIPEYCKHNAHIFYLKTKTTDERIKLSKYLTQNNIESSYHFIPLNSSDISKKYCTFSQEDRHTTLESTKILRLPLFYKITPAEIQYIINTIQNFYH